MKLPNYQTEEVEYTSKGSNEPEQCKRQWQKPKITRMYKEDLEEVFGSLIKSNRIIKISNQI